MKILVVGGSFDLQGGKSSKIIQALASALDSGVELEVINGGTLDVLRNVAFDAYDVLFWAPNISNDEEKIIPDIKRLNPRLFLISSKRVVEKVYLESDVVGRLLKTKSNLGLMITKPYGRYYFQLLDPLGNRFVVSDDIAEVGKVMLERIREIKGMTRLSSQRVGDRKEFQVNPDFLDFVRHSATEFTKYVNAINPNRLLGNASTRCMFGFPAEKQDGRLFVTQRNIDKELIQHEGFVEVDTNESVVEYYGDKKPSVDTPIQIRLFNFYKNINYMVHGHVYVEGAPFTHSKVPCGYLEEFDEIVDVYPDSDRRIMAVNLKGHGCLLMAETVEQLWELGNYTARGCPEN